MNEMVLQELQARDEETALERLRLNKQAGLQKLRRSARTWFGTWLVASVIFEVVVCALAYVYGAGNWFQRILSAWQVIVGALMMSLVVGGFAIGKERLSALGWPFTRLFGDPPTASS